MTKVEDRVRDEVLVATIAPRRAAIVRIHGEVAELPDLMGSAFGTTAEAIMSAGAAFAGPPFARYRTMGSPFEAEVGFPFVGDVGPTERIEIVDLPGGRVVRTRHVGPYETVGLAWDRAATWMREHDLDVGGAPWECYLTGPEDPGDPITEIVWPVS
jgi:effector-binding domain-containing protein